MGTRQTTTHKTQLRNGLRERLMNVLHGARRSVPCRHGSVHEDETSLLVSSLALSQNDSLSMRQLQLADRTAGGRRPRGVPRSVNRAVVMKPFEMV